jgi:hypothetical protein
MQPFEPELREALKKAHPGLTDADIEAVEAMLSRRQDIDRKRRPEEARRLDLEWQALTAQKVPKLREVMRAFDRQQIRQQQPRPKPAVEIKRKPAAG